MFASTLPCSKQLGDRCELCWSFNDFCWIESFSLWHCWGGHFLNNHRIKEGSQAQRVDISCIFSCVWIVQWCKIACVCVCSADMESGSIPDSFRPQLHLPHLKHTDRGEYFCVARNSLGTDRSNALLLNVTCKYVARFCSYPGPQVKCWKNQEKMFGSEA